MLLNLLVNKMMNVSFYYWATSVFIKNKSKIVTEVHPSPLARGFIGSSVFKRVETVLGEQVNWSID